jgi:hypothetical protein
MDTNTVVLNLNDYNQLREFKEKMEEGHTYKLTQPSTSIFTYMGTCYSPTTYVTTDLAVIELLERNKDLSEINERLSAECYMLKSQNRQLTKIKEMSIWEFIKWRKTK